MAAITEHEQDQISEANASGRTPVVFVHGLWLLPSSWDRCWREVGDISLAFIQRFVAPRAAPELARAGSV
jgi:hypothetical protein